MTPPPSSERGWDRAVERCIEVAAEAVARSEPCRWTEDEDGTWWGECGAAWQFTEGGPADNRVRYCYHCGRRVEAAPYEEPEGGEDEP